MARDHILMVDDNADTLEMLQAWLSVLGFCVTAAGNSLRAFELSSRQHFDAIVTDFAMPGMDGLEFVQRVRSEVKADLPIVVITGQLLDERLNDLRSLACHILPKPFDLDELGQMLRTLIDSCAGDCHACSVRTLPSRVDPFIRS
jgi:CheY-like chemotaxis protein